MGVGVGVGWGWCWGWVGGGELWLTDSSWLLGCHGRHEFPQDRSWHHTLVAQSLINRPMPGSVIYKYTIQKCEWMKMQIVLLDQTGSVNSCTQVLCTKFLIHLSHIFSNNWQINKLKNNPCLSNWQGLIKFDDSLIIVAGHSNFQRKIWQSRLSTKC